MNTNQPPAPPTEFISSSDEELKKAGIYFQSFGGYNLVNIAEGNIYATNLKIDLIDLSDTYSVQNLANLKKEHFKKLMFELISKNKIFARISSLESDISDSFLYSKTFAGVISDIEDVISKGDIILGLVEKLVGFPLSESSGILDSIRDPLNQFGSFLNVFTFKEILREHFSTKSILPTVTFKKVITSLMHPNNTDDWKSVYDDGFNIESFNDIILEIKVSDANIVDATTDPTEVRFLFIR